MVNVDPIIVAIAGVYSLVNTSSAIDGVPVPDAVYGAAPVGQLVYTADGYVSATLHSTDFDHRPANLTFPFEAHQSDTDWARVGRHNIGYGGPVSVNPEVPSSNVTGGLFHGPLTVANVPSMVGAVHRRNYTIIEDDEGILLRIDSRRDGGNTGVLFWRKL